MDPKLIAELVKTGKVYDLGMEMFVGMPHHPNHPPFAFSLTKIHGDLLYPGGVSASNCLFATGGHTGTHMDALGHISINGQVHGVGEIEPWQDYEGLKKAGIDEVDPVVCRGVLLDIPGLHGQEVLARDHGVGQDDIIAACKAQGVELKPGDAVLIRTGWIKHYYEARKYVATHDGCPGLTEDGARYLVEQGAAHVGADTTALELSPAHSLPVHQILIVQNGVHIIEVMNLDQLAADKVYEFVFMVSPLKIRGGTASPVRPVALA